MKLTYDPKADAAAVLIRDDVQPGDRDSVDRLDEDRFVHFDADDEIVEYQFRNVRRFGVRLDDIEDANHRAELARIFRDAGFSERTWSYPSASAMSPRPDTAAS